MAEGLRYKDKVTIVTGGSSGIGKGCATVFGKCNCFTFSLLFLCYRIYSFSGSKRISNYLAFQFSTFSVSMLGHL